MDKDSRILISGAGVAGLAAALWLDKAGFKPVIVERADNVRAGGFLVSLSHHAYHSARDLGITDELHRRSCGITGSSYHDQHDRCILKLIGETLFGGVDVVQIMRDEVVAVMYELARDRVEIRFEDSITSIDQTDSGVDVEFDKHTRETYDVVIGCDGLHSAVRELAFDPASITEHYLDLRCAAFRSPNVLGLDSEFQTHMRRTRYMATFSTGADDIGNVFVWSSDDRSIPGREGRREILQQAFVGAGGAIEKVLGHCPEDDIYMDSLLQIEADSWVNGRVAIVGDAAHCLTLFSGRGAAAALNGGTRIARALVELPYDQALARYEAQMRPVIEDIQPATRSAVRWYVPRTWWKEAMRNNAMRFLPNSVFNRYFQAKYTNI